MEVAYTIPPRTIAGRWGSVFGSECRVDDAARDLPQVMTAVLRPKAEAAEADEHHDVADYGDDIRADAQAEYRRRIGRWAREVLHMIANPANQSNQVFFAVVKVARQLHVVMHDAMELCNKLNVHRQKRKAQAEIEKHGGLTFRLATGEADKIAANFDALFDESKNWADLGGWSLTDQQRERVNGLIVLCNLTHASSFNRRVRRIFGG